MWREIEADTVSVMLSWDGCDLRTLVRFVSILDPEVEDWGGHREGGVIQTLLLKFAAHPGNKDPEFACELGKVVGDIACAQDAYERKECERRAEENARKK